MRVNRKLQSREPFENVYPRERNSGIREQKHQHFSESRRRQTDPGGDRQTAEERDRLRRSVVGR